MAEARTHIYGLHAVNAALERGGERVMELWIKDGTNDTRLAPLLRAAEFLGVKPQRANDALLTKLARSDAHQGVVAAVRPRAVWNERQLLDLVEALPATALLLLLDGVTDPHNLGACLRAACAAGAHAVVVPKDRTAGLTGAAAKAAAGAAELIPIAAVTNLSRAIKALKERGVHVVGLDGAAPRTIFQMDLRPAMALVAGSEGEGLRRLTCEHCDDLVHIPMAGGMESLNVSVAAAIALFEAVRQRGVI